MEERAEELYTSWVNGNLTDVITEVVGRSRVEGLLLASYLTENMKPRERAVFFRMLKDRL